MKSFLAILEYLYADNALVEEGDTEEMLALADRFCLPRLVSLCELYLTKKVEFFVIKCQVSNVVKVVIRLLLQSQVSSC